MADPKLSGLARAAEYAELARRIGNLALQAGRAGAHGTAGVLVDAIPKLVYNLAERHAQELDAVQMELAKAQAEVPRGE